MIKYVMSAEILRAVLQFSFLTKKFTKLVSRHLFFASRQVLNHTLKPHNLMLLNHLTSLVLVTEENNISILRRVLPLYSKQLLYPLSTP